MLPLRTSPVPRFFFTMTVATKAAAAKKAANEADMKRPLQPTAVEVEGKGVASALAATGSPTKAPRLTAAVLASFESIAAQEQDGFDFVCHDSAQGSAIPFNLLEEIKKQNSAPPSVTSFSAASYEGGGSVVASTVGSAVTSGCRGAVFAACLACSEPKVSTKTRFCIAHKRAFDCIARNATKGHTAKTPTEDGIAYQEIFGTKTCVGDDVAAAKVLCQFVQLFPTGKETSATKKRGAIRLIDFVSNKGARSSSDDVSAKFMWDFEFFCVAMENMRKWKPDKCLQQWSALEGDPEIKRDMGGGGKDPLRLSIPSWLTGSDKAEARTGTFEERSVRETTKLKTDAEVDQAQSETTAGFSHLKHVDAASLKQSLASGAISGTASGDILKTGHDLLMEAHRSQRAAPVAQAAVAGEATGRVAAAEEVSPAAALPKLSEKKEIFDVTAERNSRVLALRKSVSTERVKVETVVSDATTALQGAAGNNNVDADRTTFNMVFERFKVALAFLGKELAAGATSEVGKENYSMQQVITLPSDITDHPKAAGASGEASVDGSAEKVDGEPPTPPALNDELAAELAVVAYLNGNLSKATTACDQLPMEDIASFKPLAYDNALVNKMKAAKSDADIEAAQYEWDSQRMLIGQMVVGLKKTVKTLNKQNADAKSAVQKELNDNEQKKRDQEAARLVELQVEAKKQLAKRKDSHSFNIDFTACGHAGIQVFADDEALKTEQAKNQQVLDQPFILQNSEVAKASLSAKLGETCKRWATEFPKSKAAKDEGRSQAPLTQNHGTAELGPLWDLVLPRDMHREGDGIGGLLSIVSKPWLFGFLPTLVDHGFEPDCLGSVRLICSGSVRVFMVSFSELFKITGAPGVSVNKVQIDRCVEFMKTITDEQAKQLGKGQGRIHHASITAPAVLVTPPGYVVCVTTLNNAPASGARRTFLPKSKHSPSGYANLSVLSEVNVALLPFVNAMSHDVD